MDIYDITKKTLEKVNPLDGGAMEPVKEEWVKPLDETEAITENKELQEIIDSQQELIYDQAQEINDLHLLLGGING